MWFRSASRQVPQITGVRHQGDSVPKGGRFTIVGHHFGMQNDKGVALGGHGIHVELEVVSWSDTSIVVELPDDPRIQEGQRYCVGIERADHLQWLSNIDQTLAVGKTVSQAQIDAGRLPPVLPPIKLGPTAVLGWADLHAHPASHLAFGAGLFHGSPGLGLRDSDPARDMPPCSPDKHAGSERPGEVAISRPSGEEKADHNLFTKAS